MVLETEPRHAENTHFLVKIKSSRIYATIPGQTIIGPVLQVYVIRYLGIKELHLNDPDHNPAGSDLLLERSVAKERELGSAKMEPSSSIEETHAKQF